MAFDVPPHRLDLSEDVESSMDLEDEEHAPPTVQLRFGGSEGRAWDDRDLVQAYDAALDEFHLHHPGPGSWLDKATAALAVGRPLPGAQVNGTAWYTASTTADLVPAPIASGSRLLQRPNTKHGHGYGSPNVEAAASRNPYHTSGPAPQRIMLDRPPSPSFAPGSPVAGSAQQDKALHSNGTTHSDNNDEMGYDNSFRLSEIGPPEVTNQAVHPRPGNTPTTYIQSTASVTTEEALSHAMTAQYWSGYWMGVAQSQLRMAGTEDDRAQQSQHDPQNANSPANTNNNVLVTRQRFNRSRRDGDVALKR